MKKHILIVDDEADIRDLLAEYLGENGYRTTAVPSAIEAQRSVLKDPPQLIISDFQLEDSDGLAMITQLKETLPDTPMMLLTGVLLDPHVVRDALGKKIAAYLQKTAPLGRILEEVRQLIGS
jgi:DNA-binding NtrC family response regulator